MKARIRSSQVILLLVCLNMGVGFVILGRLLLTGVEFQTLQATEEVMVDIAYMWANVLDTKVSEGAPLDKELCQDVLPQGASLKLKGVQIYALSKTRVNMGCYVTDAAGVVLYDSRYPEREGLNFGDFNDVYNTLRGQYGARSSRSEEMNPKTSVLYVGAPIYKKGQICGVVTVYKAQQDVKLFIMKRRQEILHVCVVMALGMTLLVLGVFFWLYRPIGRLTRYALLVESGQRPAFPELGYGREINTLGEALSKLRITLEGRDYATHYVQSLTHELKSPISAIKATAELLQEEMPQHHRQRFLQTVVREVDRSEKVLDRLQQLSIVEGLDELERQEVVNMRELLQDLLQEHKELSRHKQVMIEAFLEELYVIGDPFLLRSVFQNLIDNALKFSPSSGTVTVTSHQNGVVCVENEGELIPPYAREKIFERLYSVGNNKEGKGSGVGLALVKEALLLHSATVVYTCENDKNVFTVQLPNS